MLPPPQPQGLGAELGESGVEERGGVHGIQRLGCAQCCSHTEGRAPAPVDPSHSLLQGHADPIQLCTCMHPP